jgi:hypothetical protein
MFNDDTIGMITAGSRPCNYQFWLDAICRATA